MFLFIKGYNSTNEQIIIPSNRVYNIYTVNNKIMIAYDSGDLFMVEGTFEKKLETIILTLKSSDEVNKTLRQFYKACNAGANAFFFNKESKF